MSDQSPSGAAQSAARGAGGVAFAAQHPAAAAAAGAALAVVGLLGLVIGIAVVADDDDAAPANLTGCSLHGIDASAQDGPAQPVGTWSQTQLDNAAIIAAVAAERGYDAHAAAVAINVAMVESGLLNLANDGSFEHPGTDRAQNVMSVAQWVDEARPLALQSLQHPHQGVGSDWDSVGLFQQRPYAGWADGDVATLMDPVGATGAFFDAMVDIENWQSLDGPDLAQQVQRSAFPQRYHELWPDAQDVATAVTGLARLSCGQPSSALVSASGFTLPLAPDSYRITSRFGEYRPASGFSHMGDDFAAPAGTPIYAIADGTVTHVSCLSWQGRSPCNAQIDHGLDDQGRRVTSLYVHMYPGTTYVSPGDTITTGDHIADVGSHGNSTGPHLHLEIWRDAQPVAPINYLTDTGLTP